MYYRTIFFFGVLLFFIGIIANNFVITVFASICIAVGLAYKNQWFKRGKVKMGLHSYGNPLARVWVKKDAVVVIGKYCSIADNVKFIIDGNHNMKAFSTFCFREFFGWKEYESDGWGKGDPTVGNDVWIGSDVTIHSGVHIGDGAVVAGQSVVTKSVPPYALVAGNPAVIKKYRFSEQVIEKLLRYRWWDLPEEIIREKLIPHMDNIEKVCEILEEIKNKR